jgi:hypothetical protein
VPRGKFSRKLSAKLSAWTAAVDRIDVVEEPWGHFSFADPKLALALADRVRELGPEVLLAGPVGSLGVEGGGTPATGSRAAAGAGCRARPAARCAAGRRSAWRRRARR